MENKGFFWVRKLKASNKKTLTYVFLRFTIKISEVLFFPTFIFTVTFVAEEKYCPLQLPLFFIFASAKTLVQEIAEQILFYLFIYFIKYWVQNIGMSSLESKSILL